MTCNYCSLCPIYCVVLKGSDSLSSNQLRFGKKWFKRAFMISVEKGCAKMYCSLSVCLVCVVHVLASVVCVLGLSDRGDRMGGLPLFLLSSTSGCTLFKHGVLMIC